MILNGFPCVPVCKPCREAGDCPKKYDVPEWERVAEKAKVSWQPNRIPVAELECGCRGIPWPVIRILGEGVYILCDRHGKTRIRKPKKTRRRSVSVNQEEIPY